MKLNLNRRKLNFGIASIFSNTLSFPSIASNKPKIIVIGGGAGGATVATSLKRFSPSFDIVLIEHQKEYTSCFFSNTYIGGLFPINYLTHDYLGLVTLGIQVIHELVTSIDIEKKTIRLKNKFDISYDFLVLSPGIDFVWTSIEGYDENVSEKYPHGWRGKNQTILLRQRIEEIENGGTVVIAVPKMPYRCPPGPYERACQIANYFSKTKKQSKVIILDSNYTISKQQAFFEIFNTKYKNLIEYYLSNDIDDFTIERVDLRTNTVFTKSGFNLSPSVINLIPPQRAGSIAFNSGLTESNWCPIYPATFKSKIADNIYIIGDSSKAEEMPKSAYSAYSQGEFVAANISSELNGQTKPISRYKNICWSIVDQNNAIKIGAEYEPHYENSSREVLLPMNSFVSHVGESSEVRKDTYEEALAWYQTLTSSMFNKKSFNFQ